MTYTNKIFTSGTTPDVIKVSTDAGWASGGMINLYIADHWEGYDIDLTPKEALEVSKMLKEAAENA